MTFTEIDKKIAKSKERLAKEQERLEKYTATRKEMEDEACAAAARAAAHEWNMQPEEFAKLLQTLGPDGLEKARPGTSEAPGPDQASRQNEATPKQEETAK